MDKNGFSSFLLGLGVGLGIGMLFAPKSGEETRRIIKDKTGEGTDYVKQRSTGLKDSADDLFNKGKDSAGDIFNKGKEAWGRQKDSIADAVEAGKQAYRETVDRPQAPADGAAH